MTSAAVRAWRRPELPSTSVLRVELLAGLVVALALIPEAISFSLIAGVDPKVGLYASFTMAVTIAIAGGRPAMISAATGAMALVIVGLVDEYGVEYLLAATVVAGLIQVALGLLRVPRLMRFVPRSVMTGFVNALAILIFLAQVPYIREGGGLGLVLIAAGLVVIYTLPPRRAGHSVAAGRHRAAHRRRSGRRHRPSQRRRRGRSAQRAADPGHPVGPVLAGDAAHRAALLRHAGRGRLLESLMTARLVDDITETRSDKDREARGQGMANVVTGFFGGMAGCAMIGQTMINVRVSGARTRISTFSAGVFLLALVVGLGSLVAVIPMAALVAVMILVSVSTFDWHSIRPATLKRMPKSENLVVGVTVVGTVVTHNLAIGVAAGVLTAMACFARRVAHLVEVERVLDPDESSVLYSVTGELFFASDQELIEAFDYPADPSRVIIDFSRAHVWDASAVAALDAIEHHYSRYGTTIEITGLNDRSAELHGTLSGQMAAAH